jgi:phage shock protein PspC (stress-responsive transcriptional regulator)
MKKVINITLNSIVFAIEQDAYEVLDIYIEQIKARLVGSVDQAEIMTDIESAMSEKFIAQGRSEKISVSLRDVEQLRTEMGSPADFGEDVESAAAAEPLPSEGLQRRLFRDTDDAVIAGIASGIARYFSIDPVIVRIAFAVSVFANGIGIIAYLILWLVVPAAKTTADKFAMQGKRVTVEDITARVKKNLQENDLSNTQYVNGVWHTVREFFQQVFFHLGGFMRLLVVLFRYLFGVAFLIGGALSAAVLVSIYSIVLLSEKTFLPIEVQTAVEIMFATPLGIIAIAASFVMNLIPLLVMILVGASLLKKQNLFTTNKVITLAVVWIVALVLAGTTSAIQAEKVWKEVGPDVVKSEYFEDLDIIIDEDGIRVIPPIPPAVPNKSSDVVTCTDEMKQSDICAEIYAPVCGMVDMQCFTTPCPPVQETFSNGCHACGQGNVDSYTQGVCGE